MCSIVGFVAGSDSGPNIWRIREAIKANLCRGEDAHGMAWVDSNGRVQVYKRPGSFKDNLHVLNLLSNARAVIIHMRKTTQGSEKDNINNHPHICDGGWYVHNGIIYNYSELLVQWGLVPSSECDTEVLGLITSRVNKGRTLQWQKAIDEVETRAPLAIMALYSNPVRLVIGRRGNPLSYWKGEGGLYFASLGSSFPHRGKEFRDNQVVEYKWTRKNGGNRSTSVMLKAYSPPRYEYDTAYSYCGGGFVGSKITKGERALLSAQYSSETADQFGDDGEVHEYFADRGAGVCSGYGSGYIPSKYRLDMINRAATAGKQLPLIPNLDATETTIGKTGGKTIVRGKFDHKGNPVVDEPQNAELDEVDFRICHRCNAVIENGYCDCPKDMIDMTEIEITTDIDDDRPENDPAARNLVYVDPDELDRTAGG